MTEQGSTTESESDLLVKYEVKPESKKTCTEYIKRNGVTVPRIRNGEASLQNVRDVSQIAAFINHPFNGFMYPTLDEASEEDKNRVFAVVGAVRAQLAEFIQPAQEIINS